MSRRAALSEEILDAKRAKGLTWKGLAEALEAPVEWSTAALLGQFPLDEKQARTAAQALGLPDESIPELTASPMRGSLDEAVPVDPTIYRFHEIVQVYGTTLKELIHEEFGDGIMSAINFGFNVHREPDPDGDRVVITMSGKFLPHDWRQIEP
jgi:cyanate lyase